MSASQRPADSGVAKTVSACFISVSVLFVSAGCVYITPAPSCSPAIYLSIRDAAGATEADRQPSISSPQTKKSSFKIKKQKIKNKTGERGN